MIMKKKNVAVSIVTALLLMMTACGTGVFAIGIPVPVSYLELTPDSVTMEVGGSKSFTATVYYVDGSSEDVTSSCSWSSSDPGIVSGDYGSFTGAAAGYAIVSADYIQPGTGDEVSAYADITVNQKSQPVGRTTFRISPGYSSLQVNQGVQFTATLTREGTQHPYQDVTSSAQWSVDTSVATISGQGYVVGKRAGSGYVYVSYYDSVSGQTYTDEASIQVSGATPSPVALSIRPSALTGYIGDSENFSATLRYDDGRTEDVTRYCDWSIKNQTIANNNGNGGFQCKSAGSTTVVATYDINGSTLVDHADLQVYGSEGLSVVPSSSSVYVGATAQFTAKLSSRTGGPETDVTKNCTWSVDSAAASVVGKGTIKGMQKGSAVVHCIYTTADGKVLTTYANLTVNEQSTPEPEPPVGPMSSVFTLGSKAYTIDGVTKMMEVAPFISGDRTYIAQRYLAYACGLSDSDIHWDDASQTATFTLNGMTVSMQEGNVQCMVNNMPVVMEVPPQMIEGRLCCPARYVAEAFGYTIAFDEPTGQIIISK